MKKGLFFLKEKRNTPLTDLATVESQRNELVAEEFPEGAYGNPRNDKLGKDTPYLASQHASPQYTYENREFHEGIVRQDPIAHQTHDDPEQDKEL